MQLLIQPDEELETLISGRLYIIQKKYGYRYTEDAILLVNFIKKQKIARSVLEMGTGGGIVSLLLAHYLPQCQITAIELQDELADMAIRSVQYNRLQDRINLQQADLRDLSQFFADRKYELIIMNPPFYRVDNSRLSPCKTRRVATHEVNCRLADICRAARHLLSHSGSFIFIHTRQREDEIRQTLQDHNLEIAELERIKQRILVRAGCQSDSTANLKCR